MKRITLLSLVLVTCIALQASEKADQKKDALFDKKVALLKKSSKTARSMSSEQLVVLVARIKKDAIQNTKTLYETERTHFLQQRKFVDAWQAHEHAETADEWLKERAGQKVAVDLELKKKFSRVRFLAERRKYWPEELSPKEAAEKKEGTASPGASTALKKVTSFNADE